MWTRQYVQKNEICDFELQHRGLDLTGNERNLFYKWELTISLINLCIYIPKVALRADLDNPKVMIQLCAAVNRLLVVTHWVPTITYFILFF